MRLECGQRLSLAKCAAIQRANRDPSTVVDLSPSSRPGGRRARSATLRRAKAGGLPSGRVSIAFLSVFRRQSVGDTETHGGGLNGYSSRTSTAAAPSNKRLTHRAISRSIWGIFAHIGAATRAQIHVFLSVYTPRSGMTQPRTLRRTPATVQAVLDGPPPRKTSTPTWNFFTETVPSFREAPRPPFT